MTTLNAAALTELERLSFAAMKNAYWSFPSSNPHAPTYRRIRAAGRVLVTMRPENLTTIVHGMTSLTLRLSDGRVLVVFENAVHEFLTGVDGIARRGRVFNLAMTDRPAVDTIELIRGLFVLAVAE